MTEQNQKLADYLSGKKLYGDDFSNNEIAEWYADEAEAYADLGSFDRHNYNYGYHALNRRLGFSSLGNQSFEHALGLGSAWGDEFLPIVERIKRITILDPSEAFPIENIKGVPVTYDKPRPSGDMPFAADSFDLILCFGVLHHIPNVSHVIKEMARCLMDGGNLLIREPIVSMGDWTQPRAGLTRRERGIPPEIMRIAFADAGLYVHRYTPFGFSPITHLWSRFSQSSMYNSSIAVELDVLLSRLMSWNYRYHRQNIWDRFAQSGSFCVLKKNT